MLFNKKLIIPEMLKWGEARADNSNWNEVLVSGLKETYSKKTGKYVINYSYISLYPLA